MTKRIDLVPGVAFALTSQQSLQRPKEVPYLTVRIQRVQPAMHGIVPLLNLPQDGLVNRLQLERGGHLLPSERCR